MKKAISLILVFVLVFSITPFAYAEKKFDYQTVLGSREGYEYSRSDQSWTYYRAYVYTYADAIVIVGMETYGEQGGSNPEITELYCRIQANNGDKLATVTAVEFDIDGDLYAYNTMYEGSWSSSVPLGKKGEVLMQALRDCDYHKLGIRLSADNGYTYNIEITPSRFKNTLMEFCRIYLKYDIGSYMTSDLTEMEDYYALEINGKKA